MSSSGSAGFRIERLAAARIADMRSVLQLYGEAFEDPQSYGSAPPDDAYLRDLLARENFVQLAAFAGNGEAIGALSAYVLPKFEQARSEIYIYDLAVAADHRRKGVAQALIGWLQVHARDLGAWVIYVQADHGDDPAVALYTKLGTREDVMHFDIEPAECGA